MKVETWEVLEVVITNEHNIQKPAETIFRRSSIEYHCRK